MIFSNKKYICEILWSCKYHFWWWNAWFSGWPSWYIGCIKIAGLDVHWCTSLITFTGSKQSFSVEWNPRNQLILSHNIIFKGPKYLVNMSFSKQNSFGVEWHLSAYALFSGLGRFGASAWEAHARTGACAALKRIFVGAGQIGPASPDSWTKRLVHRRNLSLHSYTDVLRLIRMVGSRRMDDLLHSGMNSD